MKPNLVQAIFLASILFILEFVIKYVAFENTSVFFRIGPSICFWATGLFFSLSLYEQFKFKGITTQTIKRKQASLIIDYGVRIPENITGSPKYLFLFIIQMCIWVINLIFSQKILQGFNAIDQIFSNYDYFLIVSSILLTGYSIGAIVSVLKNEFHDNDN